jgi:hypothetical protein
MFKIKSLLALAAFSTLCATAGASVISFDGLAGSNMPGNGGISNPYGLGNQTYFYENQTAHVEGFDFKATAGATMFTPSSGSNPLGAGVFAWNGTDYMGTLGFKMTSANAKPFSVTSLDLVGWTGTMNVLVSGITAGGAVVSQVITGANDNTKIANDFSNYTLTGFSDLKSLSVTSRDSWLAVDNIHVADAATVPEPASLTILGLGLAGISVLRRRRK